MRRRCKLPNRSNGNEVANVLEMVAQDWVEPVIKWGLDSTVPDQMT